nr:MAG TPA_asm: hypothetical protein [Caudoviricetes sp.]
MDVIRHLWKPKRSKTFLVANTSASRTATQRPSGCAASISGKRRNTAPTALTM